MVEPEGRGCNYCASLHSFIYNDGIQAAMVFCEKSPDITHSHGTALIEISLHTIPQLAISQFITR